MDGLTQRNPYRVAFEQAQSLCRQLTIELDALDHRHAALLSATKALEVMINQRTGKPLPSVSTATAVITPQEAEVSGMPSASQPSLKMTQVYVHRDLPNAIQHRIDLALGAR
jgi:hypothetical protein